MPPKPKPKLEWNDPDLQIVPKRERKKVYRPTIDRIENQHKQTTRRLRNKIRDKEKEIQKARKSRDKVKENKKVYVKKAVKRAVEKRGRLARLSTNRRLTRMWIKKWDFANQIMMYRVRKSVLNNSKYISGITAFPIIYSWCKEHKINHTTFGVFVLMNHYEWFTPADGIFFGLVKKTTTTHLKKLVELGLADVIKTPRAAYLSSVLGKETFKNFKKYHDERVGELMDNFRKAFSESDDMFDLKKYKRTRKPVEDGNKQEDTEQ